MKDGDQKLIQIGGEVWFLEQERKEQEERKKSSPSIISRHEFTIYLDRQLEGMPQQETACLPLEKQPSGILDIPITRI